LTALLSQVDGIVPSLIERAGGQSASLKLSLTKSLERLPRVTGDASKIAFSNQAAKLIRKAEDEAKDLGDLYLSTEHLLLAAFLMNGTDIPKLLKDSIFD